MMDNEDDDDDDDSEKIYKENNKHVQDREQHSNLKRNMLRTELSNVAK